MNTNSLLNVHQNRYLFAVLGGVFLTILIALIWSIVLLGEQAKLRDLSIERGEETHEASLALERLNQLIGYGGLIHHFKNYVIRQQDDYAKKLEVNIRKIRMQEQKLRSLLADEREHQALDQLMSVIGRYVQNFRKAKSLVAEGESIRELDRQVRVFDPPAIEAQAQLSEMVYERLTAAHDEQQAISQSMQTLILSGLLLVVPLALLGTLFFLIIVRLRKALTELETTRNELDLLLETTPNPVLAVNEAGKIIRANRSAIDYFGYGEALIGSTVESLMPESHRSTHVHMRMKYFREPAVRGMAPDRRIPAQLASGEVREITVRLGYAGKAAEPFSVISIQDVTEENAQRAAAERMQERIEFAAQVANFRIWQWDLEADRVHVGKDGKHHKTFVGSYRSWCKTVHPDDVSAVDGALRDCTLNGAPVEVEFRSLAGNGVTQFFQLSVGVRRGSSGMPTLVTGILHDISAARKAQMSLENARVQAVQANQSKSRFLAGMSHEIRTPMNAILGLLMLLEDSQLQDRQRQLVTSAQMSAKSMLNVLNGILDFSKLEAGKMEVSQHSFSIEGLLHQTVDLFSGVAARKGLSLRMDVQPEVHTLLVGDQERIAQIIGNLLSNAIKFTEAGAVTLSIASAEESEESCILRFSVSDTGIGMTEEHLNHIMEPFAQADMTITRNYGGTGLGLPICEALVSLLGGQMTVNSDIGEGTTIAFDLPLGIETGSKRYADFPKLPITAILVFRDKVLEALLKQHMVNWGVAVSACDSLSTAREEIGAPDTRPRFLLSDFSINAPSEELRALCDIWNAHRREDDGRAIFVQSAQYQKQDTASAELSMLDPLLISEWPTPADVYAVLKGNGSIGMEAAPESAIARAAEMVKNHRAGHVLLAEDVYTNQVIATDLLERLGMTVDVAVNGAEAVAKARRRHYDVIFMDFHMPVMGGLEAARQIKENPVNESPIIAMTAAAFEEDRIRAKAAGMDGYLTKPIDIEVLAKVLVQHLPEAVQRDRSTGTSFALGLREKIPEDFELPPQIDRATVSNIYGSNTTVYLKCLRMFATEFSDWSSRMERASVESDSESMKALAHKLKGAASNIAAINLVEAAQGVLTRVGSGEESGADKLRSELEVLLEGIQGLLSNMEASTKGALTSGFGSSGEEGNADYNEGAFLLRSFRQSLRDQRYIPPDILETWLSQLPEHIDQEIVNNLRKSIELFDYNEALQWLEHIEKINAVAATAPGSGRHL